eukprot:scaffold118140_cov51-Phaeocystis_antarctica.AAC.2
MKRALARPATVCTRGCNPMYPARTRPRPRCAPRPHPRCGGRSGGHRSQGETPAERLGRPSLWAHYRRHRRHRRRRRRRDVRSACAVLGAFSEKLLDDEGERLGGRPLCQSPHHESVGGEAQVLRPFERDVEAQRSAPGHCETGGEGDDRHEGGLDGAHTLCEHPRLVEQAARQVSLPGILRDGVTPLELARCLRYSGGGAHARQRHHEIDVGAGPHQPRGVGAKGLHLRRVVQGVVRGGQGWPRVAKGGQGVGPRRGLASGVQGTI